MAAGNNPDNNGKSSWARAHSPPRRQPAAVAGALGSVDPSRRRAAHGRLRMRPSYGGCRCHRRGARPPRISISLRQPLDAFDPGRHPGPIHPASSPPCPCAPKLSIPRNIYGKCTEAAVGSSVSPRCCGGTSRTCGHYIRPCRRRRRWA